MFTDISAYTRQWWSSILHLWGQKHLENYALDGMTSSFLSHHCQDRIWNLLSRTCFYSIYLIDCLASTSSSSNYQISPWPLNSFSYSYYWDFSAKDVASWYRHVHKSFHFQPSHRSCCHRIARCFLRWTFLSYCLRCLNLGIWWLFWWGHSTFSLVEHFQSLGDMESTICCRLFKRHSRSCWNSDEVRRHPAFARLGYGYSMDCKFLGTNSWPSIFQDQSHN